MLTIKPFALKPGDMVGVVAPSDAVEKRDVEAGVKILRGWGLKVKVGRHVYAKIGDFSAGTAEERMEDLKTMIFDVEVKVIWAATGGYAATEILPVFNRETINYLKANPKWFVGYSDMCLILNILTSFGIVNIMGPNLGGLTEWWDKWSGEYLRKMMFGEEIIGIGNEAKWRAGVAGEGRGKVLASNLETLILSFGTRYDPMMYGGGDVILCLEELDIDKSALQRQVDTVLNHKKAGRIRGIIIGRLANISEVSYPEWGRKVTAEGLITARVKKFGIPLGYLADFGHPEWVYGKFTQIKYFFANRRFYSFANGVMAKLVVDERGGKLEYLEPIVRK